MQAGKDCTAPKGDWVDLIWDHTLSSRTTPAQPNWLHLQLHQPQNLCVFKVHIRLLPSRPNLKDQLLRQINHQVNMQWSTGCNGRVRGRFLTHPAKIFKSRRRTSRTPQKSSLPPKRSLASVSARFWRPTRRPFSDKWRWKRRWAPCTEILRFSTICWRRRIWDCALTQSRWTSSFSRRRRNLKICPSRYHNSNHLPWNRPSISRRITWNHF